MFKKLLFASIVMATTSSTAIFASTPYVGGSLGVTDLSFYSSGNIQAGAIAKLFGGSGELYGERRNIYLGGELNLDLAHYPHRSGASYAVGASLIPGVMVTQDTMIYGRVGLAIQRRDHSSVTYFGNQLGLGVQTSLKDNWDIRGEYIHTSYLSSSQLNVGLVYKF